MTNVPPTKALGQEARMPSPHRDTAFTASFARLLYGSQTLLAIRASSTGSATQQPACGLGPNGGGDGRG